MKIKILLTLGVIIALSAFTPENLQASEGTFNIYSTQGQSMRCYASSIQMLDRKYNILVSCRDIIYPAQGEVFSYVVWATPTEGTKPIRLGTLGLGRAFFKTNKAFTSLYVTAEASKTPKSPSVNVVMRGGIEKIPLLERPTTPTLMPEDQVAAADEDQTDEQKSSSRQRVVTGLRRAGIIIFTVLVAMIGLIFIITRTRR